MLRETGTSRSQGPSRAWSPAGSTTSVTSGPGHLERKLLGSRQASFDKPPVVVIPPVEIRTPPNGTASRGEISDFTDDDDYSSSDDSAYTHFSLGFVDDALRGAEFQDPNAMISLADLSVYETSPGYKRYSCKECGAHLFVVDARGPADTSSEEGQPKEKWKVGMGALSDISKFAHIGSHVHVEDTLDGGLADFVRSVNGVIIPRYSGASGSPELPIGWRANPNDRPTLDFEYMDGQCHCSTIRIRITPPSREAGSFKPRAQFPDLIYPVDVTYLSKLANFHDEKWWIRPVGGDEEKCRFIGGSCMCPFCRLASSMEIQNWVYVPLCNMEYADGKGKWHPLFLDEQSGGRPEGLRQYTSSPGRYREFCQKCGATVFYWQMQKHDLILVSQGLVNEKHGKGARCEGLVDWWTRRVSFQEMAIDHSAAKALIDGLQEWAAEEKFNFPPASELST